MERNEGRKLQGEKNICLAFIAQGGIWEWSIEKKYKKARNTR